MRKACILFAAASLAACSHGVENKDAVRQAVLDRLAAVGMPDMRVEVTSVTFNGDQADATVLITAKGMDAAQGMSMPYRLHQQGGKWVVIPPAGGANPHGGAASPPAADPHGGMMPAPGDLPPVGQKK